MKINLGFEIEKSKDGLNIIKVFKDDRKIYIGSKYKMQQKINEFLDEKDDITDGNIFIIFGIGSGECLKQFHNKYCKNKMIIFEPNTKLVELIKKDIVGYEFLKDDNVYFINCNEEELHNSLRKVISEYDIGKVKYKCLLNYASIYPDEIRKFNKVIKEFISDKVINRNTNIIYSEVWFNTLISNLKYMLKSNPINVYTNKYKDVPAIIVSAGPSLSKNINELKNIDKDMLILSGGRTLKPLNDIGINPDLVGVVDPGELSFKIVEGYIEKCKKTLLFYEGTNSDVVKNHNEKKIFFTQSDIIRKIFKDDVKDLGAGGSIAHTLTMMAIELGCNPIIFIGQDLAYTGEKYHADIAINQFSNIKSNLVEEEFAKIYVEDIYGNKVRTSESLDGFRRELECIIRNYDDVTFIDATEGGAKIKGTKQMLLKDVIDKYKLNKKINFFSEKIFYKDTGILNDSAICILKESLEASKFIINKSKKALKTIEVLKLNLSRNNKVSINENLKVLDDIDEKIKEKYQGLEILNSLIYPLVYSIMSSNKQVSSNEEIINKNKFLYQSIIDTTNRAIYPMKDILNRLQQNE